MNYYYYLLTLFIKWRGHLLHPPSSSAICICSQSVNSLFTSPALEELCIRKRDSIEISTLSLWRDTSDFNYNSPAQQQQEEQQQRGVLNKYYSNPSEPDCAATFPTNAVSMLFLHFEAHFDECRNQLAFPPIPSVYLGCLLLAGCFGRSVIVCLSNASVAMPFQGTQQMRLGSGVKFPSRSVCWEYVRYLVSMMKCVTGAFLQSCEWAQDKLTERDVKLMISGRSGGSGTSEMDTWRERERASQLITAIF